MPTPSRPATICFSLVAQLRDERLILAGCGKKTRSLLPQTFFPLLLCCVLTVLTGCGKKTLPIPPQTVVPTAITDLSFTLNEQGVTLGWTYPTKTLHDRPVERIAEFEILRAEIPAADWCADCPVRFDSSERVEGGDLPGKTQKKTAIANDTTLKAGYRYIYAIRSRTDKQYPSPESNAISFLWELPENAPNELRAIAGDSRVDLSWQTPATDTSRSYQVERSISDQNAFSRLNEPLSATTFTDFTATNGTSYDYRVRVLKTHDGVAAPGRPSVIATARPRDLTAPPPPLGLSLLHKNGITLLWQPSLATDLAGYRIYRRCDREATLQAIAENRGTRTTYTDTTVPEGAERCSYAVSAFDRATPANESPLSLDSETRIE